MEKTRSKPLNRAIYTIFYRLINAFHSSDPALGSAASANNGAGRAQTSVETFFDGSGE